MTLFLLTLSIYATIVLMYVTTVFAVAQLKRDNSIMDIAYGPSFAIATWATLLLTGAGSPTAYVVATLVTIWAGRLALRIGRKNWGRPEDPRYAAWRTTWMKRGEVYFIVRSYLQVNLLQGIIIVLISLPLIIAIASGALVTLPFLLIGLAVFALGFSIESTADWQLDRFLARKRAGTETAVLMTTGLFHYSRRPNYFGESLIWWGFALIVLGTPVGYLGLIGPLVITYVVTRITGPMLEAIFLEKYPEEYRAYMDRTSYFVPLPPKR